MGVGFGGDGGVDFLAPLLEDAEELIELFRVLCCEVGGFADVGAEVVEFESVVLEVMMQFPITLADDAAGAGSEEGVAGFTAFGAKSVSSRPPCAGEMTSSAKMATFPEMAANVEAGRVSPIRDPSVVDVE